MLFFLSVFRQVTREGGLEYAESGFFAKKDKEDQENT